MRQRVTSLLFPLAFGILSLAGAKAQQAKRPYIVEWVYKVKLGYDDEFWQIFQKYQIKILDKEKELGGLVKYEVFRPSLHTSEDRRWDYRVVLYYKDEASLAQGQGLERQLFPDQATMKREERRRWEVTEVHWDLPIHEVDPHQSAE